MEEANLGIPGIDEIEDSPSHISRHLDTAETPSGLELLRDTQSSEMSEEYKEPYSSASPMLRPPTLNKSVQEFFKQSSEIQEEIRQLSEMCQQISPKREYFPSSYSYPDEEQEWNQQNIETSSQHSSQGQQEYDEEIETVTWDAINGLLEKHGFNLLALYQEEDTQIPNLNSFADTLVEVLTEYANQGRALADCEVNSSRISNENRELRIANDRLKEEV